ncbi:MAG: HNH endonuclease signature motif containing protein [Bdellovibrionota bacterium]
MQNIKSLPDSVLLSKIKTLAEEERKLTTQVLELLREVEHRRLYAQQGFSTLFEYVVKGLGYSEASAARRINSMRLLKDLPDLKDSIEKGNLNLSTVSTVQSFIKREEKKTGKAYSIEQKRELTRKIENCSQRECEKILMGISPESVRPQEKLRVVSAKEVELRFLVSQEFMDKIEKLRGLLANSHPDLSYVQLFELLADRVLDQIDPIRRQQKLMEKAATRAAKKNPDKKANPPKPAPTSEPAIVSETTTTHAATAETIQTEKPIPAATNITHEEAIHSRRFIPAALRRQVWSRYEGRCTYVCPETRKRCDSTFGIEVDHATPVSRGGESELNGLRLLCRSHNTWEAIRILGRKTMQRYLSN